MNEPVYNQLGVDYNENRKPDQRIVQVIIDLLNADKGSVIADIGAGTGNYSHELSKQGYFLKAIEPSEVMIYQTVKNDHIEWLQGVAENIPLPSNSVNGVICILAIHHFKDRRKAFQEMLRICNKGRIIIFTFDPRLADKPWFAQYFPNVWEEAFQAFPSITDFMKELKEETGCDCEEHPFLLPSDLKDLFMASGWNRPEIYLNPKKRLSMSGFVLSDQRLVKRGLVKLQNDLDNGKWDKDNGHLRTQESIDFGYRFVCLDTKFKIN